ncbi:MAG TPA: bifunctional diguanylate cyclase/phosphodiesterase [Mycobacteriales bacterium]|nr:bifunctional diguanylate cyclase/phosphodiesterase [Mycobacteriales bacterium]
MSQGRDDRRLHLLISAVLGAGAIATVACAVLGVASSPSALRLAGVLLLVVLADLSEIRVRLGRHKVTFTPGEAVLLLGFVLVGPAAVVPVTVLALTGVEVFRRVRAPLKSLFNVAASAVATSAGAGVLALTGRVGAGPASWPALALASAVVVVVQGLLVSAVLGLSTGQRTLVVFGQGSRYRLLIWVSNVILAVAVLAAWRWDRALIVAIVVLIASGSGLMRRLVRARDDLDSLRRLDVATRALPGLAEGEVLASVCAKAADLFGVQVAEIVLLPQTESGELRVFRAGPGQDARWLVGTPVDQADAVVGELSIRPRGDGLTVVVPLRAGASSVGGLRLGLPGPGLGDNERHLLAALATTAGGAVLNAQMYTAACRNAELLRAAADDAWRQARRDSLTGLGNRTLLLEIGETAIEQAIQTGRRVGLILVDLNNFKQVNSTLGQGAGDEALRQVAVRLGQLKGPEDQLIRLGGDEFAVLLADRTGLVEITELADRVAACLREAIPVHDLRLVAEGRVGLAVAPDDARGIEELLRCADIAMDTAKRTRKPVRCYEPVLDEKNPDRLAILGELRSALERNEIKLYYQPKVDLREGGITGVEALCRWQHPTRGLLSPDAFIPVLEHSELINELTRSVLGLALADLARLRRSGHAALTVAVNLSARTLLDDSIPDHVARLLSEHHLPGRQLIVEITETLALIELETVDRVLTGLRALGVRLSVDDFGTGYSSLTFLQRMDLHEVKIDRSFVAQMNSKPGDRAIVEATVRLARQLGLATVAEGVETDEQLRSLQVMGCDQAQGFLIARPMPLTELTELLDSNRDARRLRPAGAAVIPLSRTNPGTRKASA